jgi:hypothetical protein
MKQITLRMIPVIVLLFSLQGNSKSSVVTSDECSESFVGTVTEVLEVTPFSSVSVKENKLQIKFKIEQLSDGPFVSSKTVKIPKLGAMQFEQGESYKVELNDQSICHSEKLAIAMK